MPLYISSITYIALCAQMRFPKMTAKRTPLITETYKPESRRSVFGHLNPKPTNKQSRI